MNVCVFVLDPTEIVKDLDRLVRAVDLLQRVREAMSGFSVERMRRSKIANRLVVP